MMFDLIIFMSYLCSGIVLFDTLGILSLKRVYKTHDVSKIDRKMFYISMVFMTLTWPLFVIAIIANIIKEIFK